MNIELIKAIWSAGFNTGHKCGSDSSCAFEQGSRCRTPQDPQKAWDEYVQWRIDTDTSMHIDIDNSSQWEDIP